MTNRSAVSTLAREFHLPADVSLKPYTAFHIGGPADLLAQPSDKEDLIRLMTRAAELDIPFTVFGGGSNLLVRDKGIRGLVILTRKMKSDIRIINTGKTHTVVEADAGEKLAGLCRFANAGGLSGLEFAAGIPGTLGGALMMNAGTPAGCIADILVSVTLLDTAEMTVHAVDRDDLRFSYRHLDCSGVILSAQFRMGNAAPEKVQSVYGRHLDRKHKTQPMSQPSAGCFFKNPEGAAPAGKLIEDAGLKGKKINDAMVSDIHANYIVNLGNATCRDVLLLQEMIVDSVWKQFRVQLETEVRIEGEK